MSDLGTTSAPIVDATPAVAASSAPPTKRTPRKLATPDERRARVRELLTRALGEINEARDILIDGDGSAADLDDFDPENQLRDIDRGRASLLRALATSEQVEAEFQAALDRINSGYEWESIAFKAAIIEMAHALDPHAQPGIELVPPGKDIDKLGKREKPARSRTPRRTGRAPINLVTAGLGLAAGQVAR